MHWVSVRRSGVAVQCVRIFAAIESKSTCGRSGVGLCVNFIGALLHGTSMCSLKQAQVSPTLVPSGSAQLKAIIIPE